jgi:hypothetical protein
MKTKFLDYYKIVLDKVSFDNRLFLKEYKKAMNTLRRNKVGHLDNWLRENGLYSIVTQSQPNPYVTNK